MRRPLAIDLFCGLGGWAEGFLAAGFDVAGFDSGHTAPYGSGARYPGQLVIQDVLTLHGSQFRDAAVIVASPPCQNYSYLAMPWSRSKSEHSQKAKAMRRKWETEGPDNRLFDACFRIQLEAIEATRKPCGCAAGQAWREAAAREATLRSGDPFEMEGVLQGFQDWSAELRMSAAEGCHICRGGGYTERYIPLIVENVRGAQPWVGRSAWNYGSFHLWGDVPALMPITLKRGQKVPGFRFDGSGGSFQTASVEGMKTNPDGTNHPPGSWFRIADSAQGDRGQKVPVYSDPRRNGGKASHPTSPGENAAKLEDGTKIGGDGFSDSQSTCRKHGSRSNARKMASAMIAKIPRELAEWIARVYYPRPA